MGAVENCQYSSFEEVFVHISITNYLSEMEDFEDETIMERILGLTEMFPESVQARASALVSGSVSGVRWLYSMSRSASWIIFSSSAILFMPAMIQAERVGLEEMQKRQQRQVLLGPGAAVSGNPQNM